MTTKIYKQFIYCNDESAKNFPADLTAEDIIDGSIFSSYTPIVQLGVQAPPGTKFYINGNANPVIVGYTGLFDLDLTGGGSVLSLGFDRQSIISIQQNDSNILIIDILYLGGS